MSSPSSRNRRPRWPLSAQIIALLFGSLIVAQAATLCLTLVLPPAPAPRYGVDDIAAAIRGDLRQEGGVRPLMRTVSPAPPSSQSPGWLVSERARRDLALMLGADEADVRLLFYTPLPFAGAAAPPRPPEDSEPAAAPEPRATPALRPAPAAWDHGSGLEIRAGLIKVGYGGPPPAAAPMGGPGRAGGRPPPGAFGDGETMRRFPRAGPAPAPGAGPAPMTGPAGGPVFRHPGPGRMGGPDRAGGDRMLRGGGPGGMVRRDGGFAGPGPAPGPSDRVEGWVNPRTDRFASPDRTLGPLPQARSMDAQAPGRDVPWSGRAARMSAPADTAAGPSGGMLMRNDAAAGSAPSGLFRGLAAQTDGLAAPTAKPAGGALMTGAAPEAPMVKAAPSLQAATQTAPIRGRWAGPIRGQGAFGAEPMVARSPPPEHTARRPPPPPAPSTAVETTTAAAAVTPVEAPLRLAAQAPPAPLEPDLPNLSRPAIAAAAAPAALAAGGFEPKPPMARGLFGLAPAPLVEGDFVAAYREAPGRWIVVRPTPEPFPNSWQRRVLLWFALSLAVVAPIGYLFARSLTTPLTDFVKAAEHIGRDPSASVLVKEGPAEVGRAGRAFNQMQRRLKRFVDDRAAVVSALSHDLRAPLVRMRFRAEKAPPEVRAGMLQEVAQMEDMITSVLAFMRDVSESGPRESVDLRSVLECVIDDVALTGGEAVLDPGEDVLVEADVQGVRRALANLVENAVKYGESARARLYVEAGEAVVEIVDRGPGVPETELERVFQPFYRTDEARSSNKAGVGLGLVAARSMVRAHGGDVQLRNSEKGLIAQVRLPLPREAA